MLRDEFFWLNQISRATVVVGLKNGQFDQELAKKAARGIACVEAEGEKDPAKRVKSYIAWEPLFIEAAGQNATVIHAGRSSQDMLSTQRTAMLRDKLTEMEVSLEALISDLLQLAERHRDTIVPSYTNGVAAQPTSYAHYLLGNIASLLRIRERMAESCRRFNASAMGACVLNGTGWPLDREAMAEYLGFPRTVTNALDATSLWTVDFPLDVASIAGELAVRLGSMVNDIMVQYAQPRPWILLKEGGDNTYVSSAMPQKRNPGLMNNCREECSEVVGEMMKSFMRAHNVVPGMIDGKRASKFSAPVDAAIGMMTRFRKILAGLTVNPERALEELNSDWTASQEIADRLMRDHGLPFRVGHHMASRMVGFARANGILPKDFPYADMQRIYREEIAAEYPEGSETLPMTEEEFHEALDPRKIVEGRKTSGSASPQEVERMIRLFRGDLDCYRTEREERCAENVRALERLNREFSVLTNG